MTNSDDLIKPPHSTDDFDPFQTIFYLMLVVYITGLASFGLLLYHKLTYTGESGLYEMPDKTQCRTLFIHTNIFGPDSYIYKNCDNNAIYTNPAYVKQLEVKE